MFNASRDIRIAHHQSNDPWLFGFSASWKHAQNSIT